MERDEKIRLTRRLIAHVDNNTTDYAEDVLRVPFSVFDDPELAEKERAVVRGFPHIVAHVDELRKAGDFLTTELIGTPLLVVGQSDGSVRAFSNVCRHRGSKVEFAESGCKRVFACPYHNWSYGKDGSLRGMPHAEGFEGMDRGEFGLVEFPCEVRHGLVWVVPTVGADLDIAAVLGDKHDAEVTDTGIGDSYQVRKETWRLEMNWKIAVDGVQDSYHLCQLHTKTVCNYLEGNITAFDPVGRSWRLVVARKAIIEVRDADPDSFDVRDYSLANYTIYPGTMLVTEPNHFEIWTIVPDAVDPNVSYCTIRLLSPHKPRTPREERILEKNWDLLMETLHDEDWFVTKTITENAAHGQVEELIYGRNELPGQVFHKMVAGDVARLESAAPAPSAGRR
ncbi:MULTISPECIES: Rieske 2Fe-2S domain-containing protein [Nocardia]|uniref:aromatic ring-hydroxylating oxygenase subunit alpha n=1 Tax=Nocardia TaxID=1817 RepID=UPI0007EAADA7|nr:MULTISPECIES: Rieske 2Fe-2S domain-containing protein [Nocardia]OBF66745.1 ribosomal subunit interface protein [Mycobacterium sp. 852002-51759_SCH5129042]MBF6277488.1 Rieske 2Fe-2S domain-containing protein [Nocardia nova]OBA53477.1 ribosomal subunit interface protein [Nocardia sp. 852002-51101_SCH5132738]OBB47994.1 ribosomal subunit interface protein [Nocardia sp. 852002-51244_SCH5132740]PPI99595.1 ribosomal subunit interface protein [Nocardia nova]